MGLDSGSFYLQSSREMLACSIAHEATEVVAGQRVKLGSPRKCKPSFVSRVLAALLPFKCGYVCYRDGLVKVGYSRKMC